MKVSPKMFVIVFAVILCSCKSGPKVINYGVDGCHFCKMTIVDKIHAAELVTKKGKVYKFDSAECMIHFLKDFETSEIKLYLSNSFSEPETFIDATQATFLISKNIPSPMGAFLTAFKTREEANKVQLVKKGRLYTWEKLNHYLNQ